MESSLLLLTSKLNRTGLNRAVDVYDDILALAKQHHIPPPTLLELLDQLLEQGHQVFQDQNTLVHMVDFKRLDS